VKTWTEGGERALVEARELIGECRRPEQHCLRDPAANKAMTTTWKRAVFGSRRPGDGYTIGGNAIGLTGGIAGQFSSLNNWINRGSRWRVRKRAARSTWAGAIDLGTHNALDLNGRGTVSGAISRVGHYQPGRGVCVLRGQQLTRGNVHLSQLASRDQRSGSPPAGSHHPAQHRRRGA